MVYYFVEEKEEEEKTRLLSFEFCSLCHFFTITNKRKIMK